ncbi:MAG: signal peptidase II [Acidobacteriota bacterium]
MPTSGSGGAVDSAPRGRDQAEPSISSPSGSPLKRRLGYITITLAVLLADQYTKHLVSTRMHPRDRIHIVDGIFDLTYVRNDGAAFGILAGRDTLQKDLLFYATSTLAFVVLLYNAAKAPVGETWLQTGLSLVLGGAVGNLVDRIRFGSVVDFLDVHYGSWVWPTFNIADSCICVGISVMAYELLFRSRQAAPRLEEGKVKG